jgi:hypothetical protein
MKARAIGNISEAVIADWMRSQGYTVAKCERRDRSRQGERDLFGLGDLVCVGAMGTGLGITFVQATTSRGKNGAWCKLAEAQTAHYEMSVVEAVFLPRTQEIKSRRWVCGTASAWEKQKVPESILKRHADRIRRMLPSVTSRRSSVTDHGPVPSTSV